MDIKRVPNPAISRRNDERLPVAHEAYVAYEAFIEDLIDDCPVMASAVGTSPQGGAVGAQAIARSRRDDGDVFAIHGCHLISAQKLLNATQLATNLSNAKARTTARTGTSPWKSVCRTMA